MRYPFRAGAAVVVLTVALAACGSSSDGHRNAGGAGASATRPPAVSPSNGPGATASSESAAPQASEPPKPTDELTPATGSFNKKQKEYLVDRVPKGMDPAAVLQTGQETCDRLTYLVKADREVAVAAIVTGELADAKPAVEHLCTQHRELVREAARGTRTARTGTSSSGRAATTTSPPPGTAPGRSPG